MPPDPPRRACLHALALSLEKRTTFSKILDPPLFLVPFSHVLVLFMRVSATVKRSLSNCFARMVYTAYKKQRMLHFYSKGTNNSDVSENLACSDDVIAMFIKVFENMGSICRQPGSDRPSKVTHGVKNLVEQQMVGGLKLEVNIPTQQIFAKSKGRLIFEGGIITSEYNSSRPRTNFRACNFSGKVYPQLQ